MVAEGRVIFLAERYNVLEDVEFLLYEVNSDKKIVKFLNQIIFMYEDVFIKTVFYKGELINKYKRIIWLSEYSFISIIESDPTLNKIYSQWILSLFTNHINNNEFDEAVRLVLEDLGGLTELLFKFDEVKNKVDFKRLCRLKLKIVQPSDINKFKDIGDLFTAVDPFIERDVSDFKKKILNIENAGDGLIMFEDKDFLVFTPFTAKSSALLDGIVNWCTAKDGSSMFNSYTNRKKPDGKKSRLYIIFEKSFIEQGIGEIYQFHFESGQYMDRSNSSVDPKEIVCASKKLSQFFKNELMKIYRIKGVSSSLTNPYLRGLFKLGLGEYVFDIVADDIEVLIIENSSIINISNIVRLKNLKHVYIGNCGIIEIPKNIDELIYLEVLSLPDNKIKSIPKSLYGCINLKIINLTNNGVELDPNHLNEDKLIIT